MNLLDPNRMPPSPPPRPPVYVPPVPPAHSEPQLVIRPHVPRRRSRFDLESLASTIGALLLCALVIAGVGLFVNQWWKDVSTIKSGVGDAKPSPALLRSTAPVVKTGGGLPAADDNNQAPDGATAGKAAAAPGDKPTAREQLEAAVKHAREGSFDAALLAADKAKKEMPDESQGLKLMVAYVQQYSKLADDARLALNASSEIDLGPKYGKVQFIEQDDKQIKFFAKGRHETLPLHKFDALTEARFRMTRDYLDRARNPANDLILGSYNFLRKVAADGKVDATTSLGEAERRFRKAIEGGDPMSSEQGTFMLKALQADLRK